MARRRARTWFTARTSRSRRRGAARRRRSFSTTAPGSHSLTRASLTPTLSRAVLAAPPRVLSGEVDASSFEGMVAMLEDIMMDEGFNDLVGGFMKKHCGEFDEGEENKLV